MSKAPPRLDSGLIARKGEAAPASVTIAPQSLATVAAPVERPEPLARTATERPMPKGLAGTIAVTVRLDPDRYERLKVYGARHRLTNQEILVAALDAHLPKAEKTAAD